MAAGWNLTDPTACIVVVQEEPISENIPRVCAYHHEGTYHDDSNCGLLSNVLELAPYTDTVCMYTEQRQPSSSRPNINSADGIELILPQG
jgi:hypothetical protein